MKIKTILITLTLSAFCIPAFAQKQNGKINGITESTIDATLDSIIIRKKETIDPKSIISPNTFYLPLVFDGNWALDTLVFFKNDTANINPIVLKKPFEGISLESPNWEELDTRRHIRETSKQYVYLNSPTTIRYNFEMLPKVLPKEEEISYNLLKGLFTPDTEIKPDIGRIQKAYPKEVYWWKIVSNTFNISQTYFSENWHKGGESNLTILNIQNVKFGYNNKSTVEFETEIESKFSFYSTPDDTIRSLRVNDDVSFIKSKLGYKAVKNFYYTLSTEFKTQLFNSYKTNSPTRVTSFLSPANLFVNLGMDYKLNTSKITMSVILSPFSYQWIYVKDSNVDETQFGLDKGRSTKNSIGSMLTANITWAFNKQINWVSRLYYYTPYDRVEAEWENTFNFVLNRYLSTKFMWHARFDDNVARSEKLDYFQLKEMLTFGISYKW